MTIQIVEKQRLVRAARAASRNLTVFILVVVAPALLVTLIGTWLLFPVFVIVSPAVAAPLAWWMNRQVKRLRALRLQCISNDVCPHCGRHKSLDFSSLKGYRCTECASMFTSSGNVASK